MITRDTILDLAEQAYDEDNLVLRYLLLTIGGMLDRDGSVVDLPDGKTPWGVVSGADGAMGKGMAFQERRIIDNVSMHGHPMCPGPDAAPVELCKGEVA